MKSEVKLKSLVGLDSIRAYQVFHTLLLGYKMLPLTRGDDYGEFFEKMKLKSMDEKEKIMREAIALVDLTADDLIACLKFGLDSNGIPYGLHQMQNLSIEDIYEVMIALMMKFGEVKITLLTEDERKKFLSSLST